MCKYLGPSGITIVTLEKADARRKFHKELQKNYYPVSNGDPLGHLHSMCPI